MTRWKFRSWPPLIVLVLLLTALPRTDVRADVGLPPSQPGSSLSPQDIDTNVQMVSEQVEIIIPSKPPEEWMAPAYIAADFQMLNHGTEDEEIEVWFPFGQIRDASKGWKLIQIKDFQAWVEGEKQEVIIENSDEWNYIWAHWPVSFPAGAPVSIRVTYTITENLIGLGPANCHSFFYILETGAGWQGAIEEAVITVRAPYLLQELDDLLGEPAFYARPEGYTVNGTEIRWILRDLEPTEDDNIEFHLFSQKSWIGIAEAVRVLEVDPDDWEAHYKLADGLKTWLATRSSTFNLGYVDEYPDLTYLEEQIASSYRIALEGSSPDASLYLSALNYFSWHPYLIDSRDLQDYYFQAVQDFPDNEQLMTEYQDDIAKGLIREGPPPSPTPGPTPPPTVTAAIPATPTPGIPESPISNGIPNSTFLVLGVIFIGLAFALLIMAVRRRRR